ncbi:MAG: hypothetical protein NG747_05475 [Candidatus Brocadia sp.]|nr:hypothetical protein [Candidatus Brocadia sp.]
MPIHSLPTAGLQPGHCVLSANSIRVFVPDRCIRRLGGTDKPCLSVPGINKDAVNDQQHKTDK